MKNSDKRKLLTGEMKKTVGGATGLEFAVTLAMAVVIPIATTSRTGTQAPAPKPQ